MTTSRATIVTRQVDALHELIDELRERMHDQNALIDELHASRAELLEEKLRKEKGYNTLVAIADDFDTVESENERLRDERGALRDHLKKLLTYTKALQNTYRS